MSTQGSAATGSDEDEDDTEEEDEGAHNFLLPGDEGFKNDRSAEKCDSEDDESVGKQSRSGNDCRLFTSKQVNQVCNGMAEDSESDQGGVRASRQGDKVARQNSGKGRGITSNSEEERPEEESEFSWPSWRGYWSH